MNSPKNDPTIPIDVFASKAFENVLIFCFDLFKGRGWFHVSVNSSFCGNVIIVQLFLLAFLGSKTALVVSNNDQIFGYIRQDFAPTHALFIMPPHVFSFGHSKATFHAFPAVVRLNVASSTASTSRELMNRSFLIIVVRVVIIRIFSPTFNLKSLSNQLK